MGGAAAAPFHAQLAAALSQLLGAEEPDRGVTDNAASAAARLLAAGAVNDPSIGPDLVRILLAALPLQEDFEEAAAVGPARYRPPRHRHAF